MQAETEEILDWASRKMGVRFRDPGERRQKALAGLVDSGFAPESETVRAISTLLHYEPGRPFSAPFLTPADLREIERDRLREKVIAELQTLPDLPLDQRIGAYHQLRQEAGGDPWLQQRVYRAAGLAVGGVGRIEPGDPLRWLVLLPSEAVLKRPAPPPPEPPPQQPDASQLFEEETQYAWGQSTMPIHTETTSWFESIDKPERKLRLWQSDPDGFAPWTTVVYNWIVAFIFGLFILAVIATLFLR